MLSFLRIRNFAIVRDLTLRLGEGLNLLTGETGAGKSILVDALGIALGDRAGPDLVRAGSETAEVEAVFSLGGNEGDGEGDCEVRHLLDSAGLRWEGEEVIIRREIEIRDSPTGPGAPRSRQFLCESPVSVSTLRRFGELMVEIQGQHQHHALLGAEAQRDALDRFAQGRSEQEAARGLARAANHAASELSTLVARLGDRAARLDYLRFQLAELDALDPSTADEAELRASRSRLGSASRRMELAERAYRELYDEEPSILGSLSRALADLRGLSELDPAIAASLERADEARQALQDVALDLRAYREQDDLDPARLQAIEDRLAAYERLARKHGTSASDLSEARERLRAEATSLEEHEERLKESREAARRARGEYLEAARRLSAMRHRAADRLAAALSRELASLALERCEVAVHVDTEEPTEGETLLEEGIDRVELRISPNPGEPLRSFASIASGGELCRTMLAVNAALGRGRRRRTLIFDEVDAGIGGRVAAVVGEKLRALSASHQVVAITHLPQIASLADRHFVVEKRVERGRTLALVRELDKAGRVAEIARMMGGKEVSAVARRHAAEMLKKSGERPERRSP